VTARAGRIDGVLAGRRVIVCAGSGGVGKTTTAAAIAAGLAARGQRTIVLTIDPARRLADSLGLAELGNEEHRVDPERLARAGLGGDGELWAMTLDAKRTFDELIERNAPDAETSDAVLANPIYRQLSNAVAGSQEYMAMEKLYELHESGRYDALVLDAPGRLSRFVDSRSLQVFRASGRAGLGVFGRGIGAVMSVLERATGIDLLRDLADFFNAFGGMAEGFRDRARHVEALLRDDATTFLLVTSPRTAAIADAGYFRGKLADSGMPFGALIVNRVREPVAASAGDADLATALARLLGEPLARKVCHDVADRNRLAERDARNIERTRADLPDGELLTVPELSGDVHDLDGLAAVAAHLFAKPPA
jgi:anion-transporting  ArsA/GET3 family ATPase